MPIRFVVVLILEWEVEGSGDATGLITAGMDCRDDEREYGYSIDD